MSLQLAAQHLASRGRGPDSQLVHMAPQEVAGLHALAKAHGGKLTVNPDTGLPEAGFLSSLLPMLIGGALAATGIGAPLAAAMVGGGYGLATGSLSKGLMAGLGAFGGAGLGAGLMGAGAAGAGAAPLAGLEAAALENPAMAGFQAANAGVPAAIPAGTNLGTAAVTPDIMGGTAGQVGSAYGYTPPAAVAPPPPAIPAPAAPVQTITQAPPTFSDQMSQMGRGIQSLGTEEGRSAFMGNAASKGVEATGMGGTSGLMKSGLMAAAPVMAEMMTPKQQAEAQKEKLKPYEYNFNYNPVANPQAGYAGAASGERTYFNPVYTRTAAGGGLMDINPISSMSQQNQSQMQPAYAAGGVNDTAVDAYTGAETFADGGISHLGDYSDGGRLLRGPGDGVSDSIPASIGDKRPARLADGEFVVSADVVSGLGNGSTEAGARKLYAMMDRVRKARTGTKKMGKTVNSARLVPV